MSHTSVSPNGWYPPPNKTAPTGLPVQTNHPSVALSVLQPMASAFSLPPILSLPPINTLLLSPMSGTLLPPLKVNQGDQPFPAAGGHAVPGRLAPCWEPLTPRSPFAIGSNGGQSPLIASDPPAHRVMTHDSQYPPPPLRGPSRPSNPGPPVVDACPRETEEPLIHGTSALSGRSYVIVAGWAIASSHYDKVAHLMRQASAAAPGHQAHDLPPPPLLPSLTKKGPCHAMADAFLDRLLSHHPHPDREALGDSHTRRSSDATPHQVPPTGESMGASGPVMTDRWFWPPFSEAMAAYNGTLQPPHQAPPHQAPPHQVPPHQVPPTGESMGASGPAMTDAPSYRSVLSPSRQGRSGHAKRSRSDAPEIPFRLTQRRVDGSTGQGEPSGRPWPSTAGSDRTDSQSHGAPIDATPSQSVALTLTEARSSLLSFLVPPGQGSSSSIPELSLQTQDLPLTGALLTSPPTALGSHAEPAWVACDPRFTNPVGPSEE